MHYHVVRIDEEGEHADPALTFDRQDEAEERAVAVARGIDGPGWSGKRDPGRSWRREGRAAGGGRTEPADGARRAPARGDGAPGPARAPAPREGARPAGTLRRQR